MATKNGKNHKSEKKAAKSEKHEEKSEKLLVKLPDDLASYGIKVETEGDKAAFVITDGKMSEAIEYDGPDSKKLATEMAIAVGAVVQAVVRKQVYLETKARLKAAKSAE